LLESGIYRRVKICLKMRDLMQFLNFLDWTVCEFRAMNNHRKTERKMSYFIVAYNNKKQMLIESETRTTDKELVVIIKDFWEHKGWYVTVREES